ncbi:protein VAC14 homolog [Dioscorea cayenensis subsp. rotundata]|uniref:Protein VAC14 homolog n=1 Tax=Dioscorea cayennensis subsp. rotundata TaxID=55577 RepID=A0AB40D2K0_DIOCR|nr:protein VAC14 homolog [Dioscorea cayenensis subsp. rotundata]
MVLALAVKTVAGVLFDLVNRQKFKENPQKISSLIEFLSTNLMHPSQPHYRKQGGLVGLAVLTIALMKNSASPYLYKILPPILNSLTDMDMSVCECACETICEIAMVVKREIWVFLGRIFRAFFSLYRRPGINEPYFTGRLDAIIQYAGTVDGKFRIEEFVQFLRERISVFHPNERVYLLRWIGGRAHHHEDSRWFLEILVDGLFNMLWNSAPMEHGEIYEGLRNILHSIKDGRLRQQNVDFGVFSKPLLHFACKDKQETKFAALTWGIRK